MGLHGWVGAENPVLEKYANACQRAAENDIIFYSFKQDKANLPKIFSEFIFGFNLKSYSFNISSLNGAIDDNTLGSLDGINFSSFILSVILYLIV